MNKLSSYILLLFMALIIVGCEETAVPTPPSIPANTPIPAENRVEMGDRIFSIDITEGADGDFEAALNAAKSVGVQAVSLTVHWDDLESTPGQFNPEPNWLAIANEYYAAQGMQVSLTITVIDTNNLRLPADLSDKGFDDAEVIGRFNALLDYVASQLPDLTLTSVAIGNEIDIYLGNDSEQWAAYENFFEETADHARTLLPETPIGTKTTYNGIAAEAVSHIQSINQHSDAALVTYYPLDGDFTVREPATVHQDFETITAAFPEQPIYLLEVGYPSGQANDSSYEQQAAFVHEMFQAWDSHADQIQLLSYTWLTDLSTETVNDFTDYYGLNNKGFISYLATLGLRTHDTINKPAFDQLANETKARGWY